MKHAMLLLLVPLIIQGCASTRYSYTSDLQQMGDTNVLRLQEGASTELLAIGNGFPGWWGYFPGVISSTPEVASVECKAARSAIPFREPGIVFGGEICDLTAHKKGKTTLFFGNKYALSEESYQDRVDVVVEGD